MAKRRDLRAYVKFIGSANNRVPGRTLVRQIIRDTLCDRAVGFSPNRAPTAFRDGDIVYIARMTDNPNDLIIFGRGIAIEYDAKLHRATKDEIKKGIWNAGWPCLLHLRDTEFVDASLDDCISLRGVMGELGYLTLSSTERNFAWNQNYPEEHPRNVDPHLAVPRQAGLYLASVGHQHVERALVDLFSQHG